MVKRRGRPAKAKAQRRISPSMRANPIDLGHEMGLAKRAAATRGRPELAVDVIGILFAQGLLADPGVEYLGAAAIEVATARLRAGRHFADLRHRVFGTLAGAQSPIAVVQAGAGRALAADPFDPAVADRDADRAAAYRDAMTALGLDCRAAVVEVCHRAVVPVWAFATIHDRGRRGLKSARRDELLRGLDRLARLWGFV